MSKERSSGGKIPRNVSGSDLVAALKVLDTKPFDKLDPISV